RRVRTEGQLYAGDALRRVPVVGVVLRADLQVELDAGAGRLRGDGVGVGGQPLRAVDRDVQVLAPGGEDLRVQQGVPGVVAERGPGQVLRAQGRQDAD